MNYHLEGRRKVVDGVQQVFQQHFFYNVDHLLALENHLSNMFHRLCRING